MLDADKWQEIWATIRKNRLRTFLTACGVFWGMFMLVVMLGFGDGFQRGVTTNLSPFAGNLVYVWSSQTSIPHNGLSPGRVFQFNNADILALRANVPVIEHMAPQVRLGRYRQGNTASYGGKTGLYEVWGNDPSYRLMEPFEIGAGRFLNALDLRERRKVAVIGAQVEQELFQRGEDPLGAQIRIQGVHFQVVGVTRFLGEAHRAEQAAGTIHVPYTAFQQVFNAGDRIDLFIVSAAPEVSGVELEEQVRSVLAQRHGIAPEDRQGIGSYNVGKEAKKISTLFAAIKVLIWFVGVMTLLAGVIGVSNIMLIAVKERTKEIGVRKALGATPHSIVALVIQEALVLTSLAGYLGLVAGVAALELTDRLLSETSKMLKHPSLDFHVALIAAAVLVFSGLVAGILPARHAAGVNPVEALRAE